MESLEVALVKGNAERPQMYKWEENDCTVQCLRHALNISYDTAWRFCAAHGRVAREGFAIRRLIFPALNLVNLTPAFSGKTLNQAMPILSLGGTYIIETKGHVFTVKDGQLMNYEAINYRDILGVWKVKEL